MKFKLNSKLLTLGSNYQIWDEHETLAYVVRGKILSFGHSLSFETAEGKQLARIEQRLFKMFPTFDLFLGEKKFATISKKFSWINKKFLLDVPGPNDYEVEGDFWNYEYEFRRPSDGLVASVSRKYFSMTGIYGVEMNKQEDAVSILSTVVVIAICNQTDNS
jgi:uncharacterized protein YxjI